MALAVELPALAWIERRLKLRALRTIAAVLAAIVLVRLVFNPFVLDYPSGETALFNWILYG